jgi:short-subunit dehydrogenase
MQNSLKPKIIFIGSEAGFSSKNGLYGITKMAINSLATNLAFELTNFQVNVLIASLAKTEMNQDSIDSPIIIMNMLNKLINNNIVTGKIFHSDGRHCYFLNNSQYNMEL